jgi:hypothetical protein
MRLTRVGSEGDAVLPPLGEEVLGEVAAVLVAAVDVGGEPVHGPVILYEARLDDLLLPGRGRPESTGEIRQLKDHRQGRAQSVHVESTTSRPRVRKKKDVPIWPRRDDHRHRGAEAAG